MTSYAILQYSPISFDASTLEIWGSLLNGGKLLVPPPGQLSMQQLGRLIREGFQIAIVGPPNVGKSSLFNALVGSARFVPMYREILADLETPVSAYLKYGAGRDSFLLESVEGIDHVGRYDSSSHGLGDMEAEE